MGENLAQRRFDFAPYLSPLCGHLFTPSIAGSISSLADSEMSLRIARS